MDIGIKNRIAVVTGASRGIGRAIAKAIACEGAQVVLLARNAAELEKCRAELQPGERPHHAFPVDLTVTANLPAVVQTIVSSVGEPDIIVHNLGGSHGVFQALAPAEDWRRVWDFNVGIAHELNRLLLPGMVQRQWGRVVHISTLSTLTYNGYAPYVAAKCALDGYVKTMSREVSKHNVILSAVAPGAIYSEGRHFARLQKEDPKALEQYFDQHLPIRRLGQAEDIAPFVTFLCSEHAAFAAGSIVRVDGGGM